MASVSSLDKDLRNMRLSKYTPQAANEVRDWIEEVLPGALPSGDLLDALKDGVTLCKLVNLTLPPPGVKFKASSMPFVQMENISHFLRTIQQPPLSLPPHDVFLTVDLYESKDPAQVLTCMSAFSRKTNALNPAIFKRTIGNKARGATTSPQRSSGVGGNVTPTSSAGYGRDRGTSTSSHGGSKTFSPGAYSAGISPSNTGGSSPSKSTLNGSNRSTPHKATSSWSKKSDEGATAPAWNIHQYGYMGGASQGNQGIAFGARRQITSAAPYVPNTFEKEKRRREEEAEQERLRKEAEEAERIRRLEKEAEEEAARKAEEQRWEEETRRQREKELAAVEEEKKRWREQEKRWKEEEERRLREEKTIAPLSPPFARQGNKGAADARLTGQFLSQYQADQRALPSSGSNEDVARMQERERVRELEQELEQARERERRYQEERRDRQPDSRGRNVAASPTRPADVKSRSRSRPRPDQPTAVANSDDGWGADERQYLKQQWNKQQEDQSDPFVASRPLPEPAAAKEAPKAAAPPPTRPLPDPAAYSSNTNRTDRFLASNPAPAAQQPQTHFPSEVGFDSAAERHAEDSRRKAAQTKTKAGGWASKSLLEREMERERQRQQEWEEGQKATQDAAKKGIGQGQRENTVGEGGSWDVNQYGWTGGDNQNRGGVSIGGKRQIIGPRPPP
ncbi:MAG: hypothetical protein M1825_006182 [Sarcosagium campestre]|nr:MAG: hypothetical protein M1825_006182 [Sarcosagium campestre]